MTQEIPLTYNSTLTQQIPSTYNSTLKITAHKQQMNEALFFVAFLEDHYILLQHFGITQ